MSLNNTITPCESDDLIFSPNSLLDSNDSATQTQGVSANATASANTNTISCSDANDVRKHLQKPYSNYYSDNWYDKNTQKQEEHELYAKKYALTPRLARENTYYANNYMRLEELKDRTVENNPDLQHVTLDYFLDNPYTSNVHEKYAYYLHFLIIYSNCKDVDRFLNSYYEKFGKDACKMFINFPIVCHFTKNIITPAICTMLWSRDPNMIRLMYSWGADLSVSDVHNNYCENIYSEHHYYYNHLHPFVISRYLIMGVRIVDEFKHIRNEVAYLMREKRAPPEWKPPRKYIA